MIFKRLFATASFGKAQKVITVQHLMLPPSQDNHCPCWRQPCTQTQGGLDPTTIKVALDTPKVLRESYKSYVLVLYFQLKVDGVFIGKWHNPP